MAIWETTVVTGAVWFSDGRLFTAADGQILKINDNKAVDTTFEVNEDVTLTFQTGDVTGKFLGTITVDGVVYPVVTWNTFRYAVGLDKSASGVPKTLTSSDINASTFTVCFFPGTLIATPSGERKVEELVSGDMVLIGDSCAIPSTWLGRKFARAVSVKWVGRQTVSTLFGPAERLLPVRFAAGSLGGGGATSCAA